MSVKTYKPFFTEVKRRTLVVLSCTVLSFVLFYVNKDLLVFYCVVPLLNEKEPSINFLSTDVSEIFSVHITLSTTLSMAVAFVVCIYQAMKFVEPGLYSREKEVTKKTLIVFAIVTLLMLKLHEAVFFKTVWQFFNAFTEKYSTSNIIITLEPRIKSYIMFFTNSLKSFIGAGLLSTFTMLALSQLTKPEVALKRKRKALIITITLLAAVATPPDVAPFISATISLAFILELGFLASVFNKLIGQPIKA